MAKATKKATELNTTTSINSPEVSNREYASELKRVKQMLGEHETVMFSIPRQMRSILGQTIPVSINGVGVRFPVDGKQHPIPLPMLGQLKESLNVLQAEDIKPHLKLGEIGGNE